MINGKKTDFKFTFTNNTNPKRKKVILILIEQFKQLGIRLICRNMNGLYFLIKLKNIIMMLALRAGN